ncbi:MAG TPA: PDZ domain-containing protein, partial [Terriglobales bacterium]|nr:PDZ domain-containing protein [Terriglobales bacterium]
VTPKPGARRFAVEMRVAHPQAGIADFAMPEWMPGYYRLIHYSQYVSGFEARDGQGRALGWEQVTPDTWRVVTGSAAALTLRYQVAASRPFAADNSIADDRAFIAPPGMYLYPRGHLDQPVQVALALPPQWSSVATGLDPVRGQAHAFTAPNYDVLFDSPMLLGNQEQLHFTVQGVPHDIALQDVPASVDRAKMTSDLKRIVVAATTLMGTIPYDRYTFLLMGRGNGGIEHLNSMAAEFNGNQMATPEQYQRWLSYIAHEYFHNFNVKRIRPLALGPFDYEAENRTGMLWVSEGLTVYYEDLLLVRAGLITPRQYLDTLQAAITKFENEPGRPYQSAVESSWTTWGTSGVGGDRGTTISYYDNGGILGAMLDLAIRHGSRNARSLDDVMRTLYRTYALVQHRGFTDAEFRAACEQAAGAPLGDLFSYAATTVPYDYTKYFAYAGLEVARTPAPPSAAPAGGWLGLATDASIPPPGTSPRAAPQPLSVAAVADASPAAQAGIRAGDRIFEINAAAATTAALSAFVEKGKPGDTAQISYGGSSARQTVAVVLAPPQRWSYTIQPSAAPAAAASALLADWLRQH